MMEKLDNLMTPQRDTLSDRATLQPDENVILADRYRVVCKLGEGGMGSVWLAEDTSLEGRQVAIKMLPVVLATHPRAIRQLKSEARIALQLAHPHIATLRAFEESPQGPFLVMDYIPGKTLETLLSERDILSEKEVMTLFQPIAAALDYAHGQKVIHRDIKPSNILIRDDGTAFITDFGIAREVKETMTRVTGRTTSGTLPYMSPEQMKGDPPSPAQDIYSLGATLYECLTGHPPFYRGQIEYQIVNSKPQPFPFSTAFTQSVLSCLEKTPESRPESATAVIACDVISSGTFRSVKDSKTTESSVSLPDSIRNAIEKENIRLLKHPPIPGKI